ncbi:MAG: AmmeMemoRadiSam system radical SAM enzyme [Lachnospiraceae bacterium]|jgi:pyruvate formate lyase activating enzyme|nr:AmmeMemoRadiSam system radical SAM enzyme [Lachnospiraceae bacterium]
MRAKYYENLDDGVKCTLCPHNCFIANGRYGLCNTRRNLHGVLYNDNYGKVTSLALDPIEKKPLYHFHSHTKIWSVGSYGCNMKCGFCQNSDISQFDSKCGDWHCRWDSVSPEKLLSFIENENAESLGIAFTYNEPCLSFEYILDAAPLFHKLGYKVVMVSNGQINPEPLAKLATHIDAWNIDIKAFNSEFYKRHGGNFKTAKHTVEYAAKTSHVEVTTLVIPQENDSEEEMIALTDWLAGINPEIPLHLSRYFPRYKYN